MFVGVCASFSLPLCVLCVCVCLFGLWLFSSRVFLFSIFPSSPFPSPHLSPHQMLNCVAVFPDERNVFYREKEEGTYTTLPFFLSYCLGLPLCVFLCVCVCLCLFVFLLLPSLSLCVCVSLCVSSLLSSFSFLFPLCFAFLSAFLLLPFPFFPSLFLSHRRDSTRNHLFFSLYFICFFSVWSKMDMSIFFLHFFLFS